MALEVGRLRRGRRARTARSAIVDPGRDRAPARPGPARPAHARTSAASRLLPRRSREAHWLAKYVVVSAIGGHPDGRGGHGGRRRRLHREGRLAPRDRRAPRAGRHAGAVKVGAALPARPASTPGSRGSGARGTWCRAVRGVGLEQAGPAEVLAERRQVDAAAHRPWRTARECSAASTSGCASSTWYSIGSLSCSRENQTSPSRCRLLRYDGTRSRWRHAGAGADHRQPGRDAAASSPCRPDRRCGRRRSAAGPTHQQHQDPRLVGRQVGEDPLVGRVGLLRRATRRGSARAARRPARAARSCGSVLGAGRSRHVLGSPRSGATRLAAAVRPRRPRGRRA